jgi:hypothetical protein
MEKPKHGVIHEDDDDDVKLTQGYKLANPNL